MTHPHSEPLQAFDQLAQPLDPLLRALDERLARFRQLRAAGRILPNSIEALRVELTYHSNAIEGNTLSLRQTRLVLDGLSPGNDKTLREIDEARNHDRALRLIETWASTRPHDPLSDRDLLDIHALVLADIDSRSAGRFRAERVLIKGTRYIPPGSHKFPELIPAALNLANRAGVHPVLQAAEFHDNLVAIHPFADGNGRTARLLMNFSLLRQGWPHAIIEVDRRADYLAALEEANQGRCGPFARFILESAAASIDRLIGP